MTKATNYVLAITIASIGANCIHADDPTEPAFEIAAFIVGIEGQGFIGNNATEVGESWEFPTGQAGSYYVHSVEETPIEFEEVAISPLGGGTYGRALCTTEVTDTTVSVQATTLGIMDGGDAGEFAESYAQVHGEFHIQIDEPALIAYHLCNDTAESSAIGKIYIRKLVNGNFQTMIENVTTSDSGIECVDGDFEAEPGYYQLYFSSWVNANNQSVPGNGWDFASTDLLAMLEITALPEVNVADLTGDGKVDGADLARLLGAWGNTSGGGDLNGDGIVDGQDLALLLGAWTG